jgi:hypothetical protein
MEEAVYVCATSKTTRTDCAGVIETQYYQLGSQVILTFWQSALRQHRRESTKSKYTQSHTAYSTQQLVVARKRFPECNCWKTLIKKQAVVIRGDKECTISSTIQKKYSSSAVEPTVHKPLHILRIPTAFPSYNTVVHFILCMVTL